MGQLDLRLNLENNTDRTFQYTQELVNYDGI